MIARWELIERVAIRSLIGVSAVVLLAAAIVILLWRDRTTLEETGIRTAQSGATAGAVTVTWFGVTTLLFDDGETQVLIDGLFSRPGIWDLVLNRPIDNDAATINYALNRYRMRRLAAIIPLHSHFDHAFDIGAIANRSSASVLGSASTANIARGAGVPEDQIVIVEADTGEYTFGQFTVRLIKSQHAPIGWRGRVPIAGTIDRPLTTPASFTAWREGGSFSVVVAHPQGTALVQGSAGFVEGAVDDIEADVVLLSVALLEGLGRGYAERYWQALVTATGASIVVPIHFDDFTSPFGDIRTMPRIIDNFARTATWLESFRATWDTDTRILLPPFGEAIELYPEVVTPEA